MIWNPTRYGIGNNVIQYYMNDLFDLEIDNWFLRMKKNFFTKIKIGKNKRKRKKISIKFLPGLNQEY